MLRDAGELNEVAGQFYFAGGQNPAARISLRHMSDNTFSIVLRGGRVRPAVRRRSSGQRRVDPTTR